MIFILAMALFHSNEAFEGGCTFKNKFNLELDKNSARPRSHNDFLISMNGGVLAGVLMPIPALIRETKSFITRSPSYTCWERRDYTNNARLPMDDSIELNRRHHLQHWAIQEFVRKGCLHFAIEKCLRTREYSPTWILAVEWTGFFRWIKRQEILAALQAFA